MVAYKKNSIAIIAIIVMGILVISGCGKKNSIIVEPIERTDAIDYEKDNDNLQNDFRESNEIAESNEDTRTSDTLESVDDDNEKEIEATTLFGVESEDYKKRRDADYGESYEIEYYLDQDSMEPSNKRTQGINGTSTALLTIHQLGFAKAGYAFLGWRINRSIDDKWFLKNTEGKNGWYTLKNGELPEGFSYSLRNDGGVLTSPTSEGVVRLYAFWGEKSKYEIYSIEYYPDVDAETPSAYTNEGIAGVKTRLLTLVDLGFSREGATFEGWRIFRSVDNKWFLKNDGGKSGWYALANGELPSGFSYDLRGDGSVLISPAKKGTVKLFAQWSV